MKQLNIAQLGIFAFLLYVASAAHSQVAGSLWQLTVEDLNHRAKAKATIRFTEEVATESCMGGPGNVLLSTPRLATKNFSLCLHRSRTNWIKGY